MFLIPIGYGVNYGWHNVSMNGEAFPFEYKININYAEVNLTYSILTGGIGSIIGLAILKRDTFQISESEWKFQTP